MSWIKSNLLKYKYFIGCEDSEEEDDYDGDESEEDEGMEEEMEEAINEGKVLN